MLENSFLQVLFVFPFTLSDFCRLESLESDDKKNLEFKMLIQNQHLWKAERKLNCRRFRDTVPNQVGGLKCCLSELCPDGWRWPGLRTPALLSLGLWTASGSHELGKGNPKGTDRCCYLPSTLLAARQRALFDWGSGCRMSLWTRVVWTLSVPHTQDSVFLIIHVTPAVLSSGTRGSHIYWGTGALYLFRTLLKYRTLPNVHMWEFDSLRSWPGKEAWQSKSPTSAFLQQNLKRVSKGC